MRLIRLLLIYLVLVFVGGALLAPWLYQLTLTLAEHSPAFVKLASNPFPRFVNRALLAVAVLGLWPLLRGCGMRRWRDLGLMDRARPLAAAARGFLLGFGSLASVAFLALLTGGRIFNPAQSSAEVARHILNAAFAAIVVAILEEFIFRGALFGILRKVVRWPSALVISSAIYALVHFLQKAPPPAHIDWLAGLNLLPKMFFNGQPFIPAVLTLFTAGAILALAYQRTGTLFFSMGLHAGWIFWLKSYGFLTAPSPQGNAAIWGTDKLIDGWLALPILGVVFCMVWRTKPPARENE